MYVILKCSLSLTKPQIQVFFCCEMLSFSKESPMFQAHFSLSHSSSLPLWSSIWLPPTLLTHLCDMCLCLQIQNFFNSSILASRQPLAIVDHLLSEASPSTAITLNFPVLPCLLLPSLPTFQPQMQIHPKFFFLKLFLFTSFYLTCSHGFNCSL